MKIQIKYFLCLLLFLPDFVKAESVDLSYVVTFGEHGFVTYDLRTDIYCKDELGFTISTALNENDLIAALKQRNIEVSKNSRYSLKVYLTHKDCGSVGKKDVFSNIFFSSEDSYANADVRVVSELQDKVSGEIVSIREYISLGKIKKNISGSLFLYWEYQIEDIYWRDLWTPLLREIVSGVEKDL